MSWIKDFNNKQNQDQSANKTAEQAAVIPVVEEKLVINREVIETGKVRIDKHVHNENITLNEPVFQENIEVERVALNQYVDHAPPAIRYEGDKTIIPVLKEVLVVEKRLMLVEELHITKTKKETRSPQQVTLRREEVVVEKLKTTSPNNSAT